MLVCRKALIDGSERDIYFNHHAVQRIFESKISTGHLFKLFRKGNFVIQSRLGFQFLILAYDGIEIIFDCTKNYVKTVIITSAGRIWIPKPKFKDLMKKNKGLG